NSSRSQIAKGLGKYLVSDLKKQGADEIKPRIAVVRVHNSSRSQIAKGLGKYLVSDAISQASKQSR
ncbi:MAG: hypothetical protein RR368_07690, partial [Oscillospiraceae bacterium]